MVTHLQDQPDQWQHSTDEQIIHALFQPVRFVCPSWMAYLKRSRPSALATYLRLFSEGGERFGPPAQRFLKTH
jgi:hypothetical protein